MCDLEWFLQIQSQMMFLSAGMVFLIYLSIHSPSINFQLKRDGKAGSDGFIAKLR